MPKTYVVRTFGWGSGTQVEIDEVVGTNDGPPVATIVPDQSHDGLFVVRSFGKTGACLTVSAVTLHDAFGLAMTGELRRQGADGGP